MKFGTKFWDGPNLPGASRLKPLRDLGLPYASHITDEFRTDLKGQFSQVTGKKITTGYFIARGTAQPVVSKTATGTFKHSDILLLGYLNPEEPDVLPLLNVWNFQFEQYVYVGLGTAAYPYIYDYIAGWVGSSTVHPPPPNAQYFVDPDTDDWDYVDPPFTTIKQQIGFTVDGETQGDIIDTFGFTHELHREAEIQIVPGSFYPKDGQTKFSFGYVTERDNEDFLWNEEFFSHYFDGVPPVISASVRGRVVRNFMPVYHYKIKGESWASVDLPRKEKYENGTAHVMRAGPSTLVGFVFVRMPMNEEGTVLNYDPPDDLPPERDPGNPVSYFEPPVPLVVMSDDNGETWEDVESDFWNQHIALWRDLTIPEAGVEGYTFNYYEPAFWREAHLVPIGTNDRALLVTQYRDVGTGESAPGDDLKYKSEYNSRTYMVALWETSDFTKQDPLPLRERDYGLLNGFPFKTFAIFQFCSKKLSIMYGYGGDPEVPFPQTVSDNDGVHHLWMSDDGGSNWVDRPLPWATEYTGLVTPIDTNTLVVPVFDGEYSLYQSTDLGETWSKRATLLGGLVTPPYEDGTFMHEFHSITMLRDLNGNVASTTPGAPWATDHRKQAPF